MASLKDIRRRIGSVKSTQQITKAMKMVAAAKLRRAQEAAQQARPYADKLAALLHTVATRVEADAHPLLAAREPVRRVDLILVTADRGLCGGYNSGLIRRAEAFIAEHPEWDVRVTAIGIKGAGFLRRRGVALAEEHVRLAKGPDHTLALQLAARVARDFVGGETDAVYLIYSQFRSAISQIPTTERLLPVAAAAPAADTAQPDYIFEPDEATLLDRLLRQYVTTLIDRAFLESIASEQGARMTAMENATTNASDMIDRLTLAMNRARQAAITTELMEIVSGAEALKG
ncbi:MAG: ATP synthase F1 subunit gamma [Candidatus Binatia bacterium]